MDIYKFLNSKDVAAHLKSMDYPFNPLELAFFVYFSGKATYRQKIKAFEEILTLPDCKMPRRMNYWHENSLHALLKATVAEWKRYEREFYTVPGCVYSYRVFQSDAEWQYPTLEEALAELKREYDEEDLKNGYTVRKQQLTAPYKTWNADFDKRHRLMALSNNLSGERDGDEKEPHSLAFEGLWLDIPVPFCKGDILINRAAVWGEKDPFVLESLPNWKEEQLKAQGIYDPKEIERCRYLYKLHQEKGDYSDMCAYALFADWEEGVVRHGHPMTYVDFEYYRGKLDGGYGNLKTLSNYLKGGWGIEYLLTNYVHRMNLCKTKYNYFDD